MYKRITVDSARALDILLQAQFSDDDFGELVIILTRKENFNA